MGRPRVAVLALQGDFSTHAAALARGGAASPEGSEPALDVEVVRTAADLERARTAHGLILPGGESTAMLRILELEGLTDSFETLVGEHVAAGKPVLATCAGVVLLARAVEPPQRSLGLLDVSVVRNADGPQIASGVHAITGEAGFPDGAGTFIRAPRIVEVGSRVDVLARRERGDPVLVRQGSIIAATFHPELDEDHPVSAIFVRELLRVAGGRAIVSS